MKKRVPKPPRENSRLAAATGLRLAIVDFLMHAALANRAHIAWHLRGRSAVARFAARWFARHLPPGLSPDIARDLGRNMSQGAIARLLDDMGGAYLMRRTPMSAWELVGSDDYQSFRNDVAARGEALTLVFVDRRHHEMTVTRTLGGLLHGPDPSCPAILRICPNGRHTWFYEAGIDITARVARGEDLNGRTSPAPPGQADSGPPRTP